MVNVNLRSSPEAEFCIELPSVNQGLCLQAFFGLES